MILHLNICSNLVERQKAKYSLKKILFLLIIRLTELYKKEVGDKLYLAFK